jgi:hypothetical protein
MLPVDHDIRRHLDGSIDFDFYRRRAARLRRTEMQAFFAARMAPLVRPAIAVGILVASLLSLPALDDIDGIVVHAHSHPPVAASSTDPAAVFRRTAADLFGIVRLAGDGVPGPRPHDYP